MKISEIKLNPANPRLIKDAKFKKLLDSLRSFPQMMELRPIVVDENNIIQGGNMRFRALKELGYTDIPDSWVKQHKDFTPDQWREFVIKDNVQFGEWDMDMLANEWDAGELEEWGVDAKFDINLAKIETLELKPFKKSYAVLIYNPDLHIKIQDILKELKKNAGIEIETFSN